MGLISKVLGFLLGKALWAGALLLFLFLSYLLISTLIPALQDANDDRVRLEKVVEERKALSEDLEDLRGTYGKRRAEAQSKAIESLAAEWTAEVGELKKNVSKQKSKVEDLRRDEDEACGFLARSAEAVLPGPNPCEAARRAVASAEKTLRTFERGLGRAEHAVAVLEHPGLTNEQKLKRLGEEASWPGSARLESQIEGKKTELNSKKAEERSLTEAQGSGVGWVVRKWVESWKWLLGIVLLGLLLPVIWRTVSYFLLMPLVSRAQKPLQLVTEPEPAATLHTGPAERTLPIRLSAGEVLSARSEYVRPVQGNVRGRILYDWTAPFISFAAGLYGLSRITGDGNRTEATLATPNDPNSYLMRIDFKDHPGVVMHPRHVVGVLGAPELETRWRWGIQSFATWQVRYIMFVGTGSLIVQGSGDVVATSPGDRSTKMEQDLMMGFDARLTAGVRRTEVFWPYLWGKTPLVDDEFTGRYPLFWQKSRTGEPGNPIEKAFSAVFSALGKLLGF